MGKILEGSLYLLIIVIFLSRVSRSLDYPLLSSLPIFDRCKQRFYLCVSMALERGAMSISRVGMVRERLMSCRRSS
jgi:hypothetical protein